MIIKVLGTQSPYTTEGRHCPGFLVTDQQTKILLDCGSGSHSLLQIPQDLQDLSVILSHLHRDHYNDIYNLQYASTVFHRQNRLEKPLDIYLPADPEPVYRDITGEHNAYARYFTINASSLLTIGSLRVTFCRNDHSAETYAVKLTDGKKTLVYTSDTSYSGKEKLIEFARDADLLISESSLLKSHGFPDVCPHLTAAQAAQIAKEAGVRRLLLTHFWPEEPVENYVREAAEAFPNVTAASEGMTIDMDQL